MYTKLTEKDFHKTNGTHYLAAIDTKYRDLLGKLGAPTFEDPSGDDKVQKEWVFYNDDEVFTVYDWKTWDEEYTMNELTRWHVGGVSDPSNFIKWLEKKMYNNKRKITIDIW
jgi:hypothetical protein